MLRSLRTQGDGCRPQGRDIQVADDLPQRVLYVRGRMELDHRPATLPNSWSEHDDASDMLTHIRRFLTTLGVIVAELWDEAHAVARSRR